MTKLAHLLPGDWDVYEPDGLVPSVAPRRYHFKAEGSWQESYPGLIQGLRQLRVIAGYRTVGTWILEQHPRGIVVVLRETDNDQGIRPQLAKQSPLAAADLALERLAYSAGLIPKEYREFLVLSSDQNTITVSVLTDGSDTTQQEIWWRCG